MAFKLDKKNLAGDLAAAHYTGGLSVIDNATGGNAGKALRDARSDAGLTGSNIKKQIGLGSTDTSALKDPNAANRVGVDGIGSTKAVKVGGITDPRAAVIATGPQSEFRNVQSSLAAQLAGQAAGTGPSIVGRQLQDARDANIAATMAQVASTRGGANPAVARQAIMTGAQTNNQLARDAGTARLQEQMQAAGLLNQVATGARGADIGLATDQARLQQEASIATAQMENQRVLAQAQQDAQFQQLQLQYQQMGLDAQKANQMAALDVERMKQANNQSVLSTQLADAARRQQMVGGLISGAATVGAAMASDENLKTEITDGSKDIDQFLSTIGTHKYKYKNSKYGAGRYVSPMAQELERTALGKSMVVDTPEGKMVDYGKGFGALLAGQAYINKRLKELEEGK